MLGSQFTIMLITKLHKAHIQKLQLYCIHTQRQTTYIIQINIYWSFFVIFTKLIFTKSGFSKF